MRVFVGELWFVEPCCNDVLLIRLSTELEWLF